MKILRMQASFGCLNGDTLELQDGLNLLCLPNEAGKSTWSAFLLAMFYGIDTSERARAGFLPAKTRYKPWSGAPLQGSVDLLWQGRAITIERTSTGRAPMGVFRAYETVSGAPVPELTGETCGRILLGVERSVYERSAFLRQNGLAVLPDSALEARLQALVTTGDEGSSYSSAEALLRSEWNRLARSRTGRADQLTEQLHRIREQERQLSTLAGEDFSLRTQCAALDTQYAALRQQLQDAEAWAAAEKLQTLQKAQSEAHAARQALTALQSETGPLPDEAALAHMQQALLELPPLPDEAPALPVPPTPPEPLRGLEPDAARAQLQADLLEFDALEQIAKAPRWPLLTAAVLAAAAIALLFFLLPAGLACGAAALVLLALGVRKKRAEAEQERAATARRDAVRARYGHMQRTEIEAAGQDYLTALAAYRAQQQAALEARARCDAARSRYESALGALLAALAPYAAARNAAEARAALQQLQTASTRMQQARARERAAWQYAEELSRAYGDVQPPAQTPQERPARQPAELRSQTARLEQQRAELTVQLERRRGQLQALGDPAVLSAQADALSAQLESVQLHADALQTALEALSAANSEIQTRFSPALNELASQYMARLTGGRYDRVLLEERFSATAHLAGDSVQRPQAYLSAGTADQLYLAIRLAIYALAVPEETGAPLVLDDALAFFDDARCARALELLKELARTRQVLLFTCQGREAQLLK